MRLFPIFTFHVRRRIRSSFSLKHGTGSLPSCFRRSIGPFHCRLLFRRNMVSRHWRPFQPLLTTRLSFRRAMGPFHCHLHHSNHSQQFVSPFVETRTTSLSSFLSSKHGTIPLALASDQAFLWSKDGTESLVSSPGQQLILPFVEPWDYSTMAPEKQGPTTASPDLQTRRSSTVIIGALTSGSRLGGFSMLTQRWHISFMSRYAFHLAFKTENLSTTTRPVSSFHEPTFSRPSW